MIKVNIVTKRAISLAARRLNLAHQVWRIRSHSTRGFKSWAGLEGAFLLCSSQIS